MLVAHTGTTHHYVWFQGKCEHPDALLGTSVKHLHRATVKSPRQRHRQHDSAALSPVWLGIYITSRPSHPASPSPAWLGSIAAAWLSSITAAWLSSIAASMTRHLHHVAAKFFFSGLSRGSNQHCKITFIHLHVWQRSPPLAMCCYCKFIYHYKTCLEKVLFAKKICIQYSKPRSHKKSSIASSQS